MPIDGSRSNQTSPPPSKRPRISPPGKPKFARRNTSVVSGQAYVLNCMYSTVKQGRDSRTVQAKVPAIASRRRARSFSFLIIATHSLRSHQDWTPGESASHLHLHLYSCTCTRPPSVAVTLSLLAIPYHSSHTIPSHLIQSLPFPSSTSELVFLS